SCRASWPLDSHLSPTYLFRASSSYFPLTALLPLLFSLFFFNDTATTEIYTLSLHDALPIFLFCIVTPIHIANHVYEAPTLGVKRSEEHTSELQSRFDLVCRLLLEKKKKEQKR